MSAVKLRKSAGRIGGAPVVADHSQGRFRIPPLIVIPESSAKIVKDAIVDGR
jgi:hypothetical protein